MITKITRMSVAAAVIVVALAGHTGVSASMLVTVPQTSQPPVLDGVMEDAEWDGAAAVTGVVNQLDGLAHPRQATFWVMYDRENVYVAQRSTVLPQEREVRAPQLWLDRDSSFVVILAPGTIGVGDEPSHYKLRSNITGQQRTSEITWKTSGVRLTFPHPSWNASATIEHAFTEDDSVWTTEMTIPLSALNVDKMAAEQQWGLLLARDYAWADQNAIVKSSDWRFGGGRRHYGRAFFNNYRLENEYARATLSAGAPAIQLLDLGEWRKGMVTPRIAVKNTSGERMRLTAKLDVKVAYGSGNQDPPQSYMLSLQPGERRVHAFDTVGVPPGNHELLLSVEEEGGKTLYSQTIPFRPDYAADRAEPVPDVYFQGYHFGGNARDRVLMPTVYDPFANEIYARVRINNLPEPAAAARAEVTVRRSGELRPFFTMEMPPFYMEDGRRRHDISKLEKLPLLRPGVYEATASVYNNENALLARSRQVFIRYNHEEDLPWIGRNVGVSDHVLPPWTPMETEQADNGLRISPWGRTYHVNPGAMFARIDTIAQAGIQAGTKRDILAGEARFELVRDGQPVALEAGGLTDIVTAEHAVSYSGKSAGGGWTISTAVRMDYDGYALHTVRIEPPENGNRTTDHIRLVVPLKPEEATHLHAAAGAWFRASVSAVKLNGDGVLWHSGQSHGGPAFGGSHDGKGLTVGNFKPYVWVGGAQRGIAFMADSDKDWVPDDTRQVPAIEVVRDGDAVNLVLNLVARPFEFDRAREVQFSLQATPVKPLDDGFRHRLERLHMATAFPGYDPNHGGWDWNGCRFIVNGQRIVDGHGSQPYPLNWERNIAQREFMEKARGHIFTPYQSQLNAMSFGEVDDPRMAPGIQASNFYGYAYPQVGAGCHEHGNLNISMADVEFRIWHYRQWIREAGLSGLYFDQTEPILGANVSAGCGYRIDLHDRPNLHGRIQPGYLVTNTREFYKRLRTVFVEAGVEKSHIWLHTTDADMVSAFAFADFFLEGENTPMLTPDYPWVSEKYRPERMEALSNPAKWGFGIVWLSMIDRSWNWPDARDKQHMTGRAMQGYARLFDFADGWNYLRWAPFDTMRRIEFYPYWDDDTAAVLRPEPPHVYSSAYRQDNRLKLVVFNRSKERAEDAGVSVDVTALGMTLDNAASLKLSCLGGWGREPEPFEYDVENTIVNLKLDIRPHDYRLILIESVHDK